MTFDEEFYFKKSGDDHIVEGTRIDTDRGFLIYEKNEQAMVIVQACGDGKFLDDMACSIAKESGLKSIAFLTRRNHKAFERKYGYTLSGYVMEKEI